MDVARRESKLLVPTYKRPEVVFDHGQGAYLFDTNGKRYLDFAAGIAVNALGHGDPAWVAAVAKQAGELVHVSNLFHTAPHVRLAAMLVASSFAERVFFCNSGAEANEAALKFARKQAYGAGNRSKTGIVAFEGGFHGRTFGALSVTHNARYREPFAPLVGDVQFCSFNDVEAARALIGERTCAVIVEPLQGEGGVHAAAPDFLRALRARCTEVDAVLIFDEVQCGLGRSGVLWAHQAHGVAPDILTAAKPLANGLPIGAVLVTEKVAQAVEPGDHGSTFAGGPLVCRAAEVVVERVSNPSFLRRVRDAGRRLRAGLEQLGAPVVEIRGEGLLIGIELEQAAAPVVERARDGGLIVITAGPNVLRLTPPLIVTDGQIDSCVATLRQCLAAGRERRPVPVPGATEVRP